MSLSRGGSRYIAPNIIKEADYLESVLPLEAFVTLTLPHHATTAWLDGALTTWLASVQEYNLTTLGYVRSYEREPQHHVHVVLVTRLSLHYAQVASAWRELYAPRYRSAADVRPYQRGLNGLAYVMKSLDSSTEDVQFSANLSAFVPSNSPRAFKTTSEQRRQRRRILAQHDRRFGPPLLTMHCSGLEHGLDD